ncbi:MAG TPA: restriction endonuclease subunit S [Tepidisphaeraceae bacterium]
MTLFEVCKPIDAHSGSFADASELPEGWLYLQLREVGTWCTGGTPSRKVPAYFGGKIPWVKSGDLNDGVVTKTDEFISDAGLENSAAKLLPRGTLSVALYGATIGKVGILAIDAATNQACANCVLDEGLVDRAFLFHYVISQRQALIDAGQGGAQPNISNEILKNWPLAFPPLAEQRRIAAKVEAVLAKASAARQRLAKVPAILNRFRQSVLAAACSGRLTEDWRNASDTRDNDANSDVPAHWVERTISEACTAIVDCPHSTPKWTPVGKLCVRTTNFKVGVLDLSEVRYVAPEEFARRISRLRPEPGDVLYSREGGILGIACEVPAGTELCLGQRMMLMRADAARYASTFLMHVLNSPDTVKRVEELTGGSASPHLNVGDIKRFPVPTPPLAEQHEIVRRVSALFALADKVEARLAAATAAVERVTRAVLAKAFRGELVETEASLARREGRDYEPAAKLLERISAAHRTSDSDRAKRTRQKRSRSTR